MKKEIRRNDHGDLVGVDFYSAEGDYCIATVLDGQNDGKYRLYIPVVGLNADDMTEIEKITVKLFGRSRLADCRKALEQSTLRYGFVCVCRVPSIAVGEVI